MDIIGFIYDAFKLIGLLDALLKKHVQRQINEVKSKDITMSDSDVVNGVHREYDRD